MASDIHDGSVQDPFNPNARLSADGHVWYERLGDGKVRVSVTFPDTTWQVG